jgi:hypothetical protein
MGMFILSGLRMDSFLIFPLTGDNIDNVKVLVRVKPSFGAPSVVKVLPHLTALQVETKPDKQFYCDYIADEDAPQVLYSHHYYTSL